MNFGAIGHFSKKSGYSSLWFSGSLTEATKFIYYGNMKPKNELRFVSGLGEGGMELFIGRILVDSRWWRNQKEN
jgi:hypothetical protein